METERAEKTNSPDTSKSIKTSRHAIRYLIVGILVTAFNYALFAILSNLIIKNNDLIWLSNLIATAITTIVAYFAHSRITWKERTVTRHSVIRFFIWNAMPVRIVQLSSSFITSTSGSSSFIRRAVAPYPDSLYLSKIPTLYVAILTTSFSRAFLL